MKEMDGWSPMNLHCKEIQTISDEYVLFMDLKKMYKGEKYWTWMPQNKKKN